MYAQHLLVPFAVSLPIAAFAGAPVLGEGDDTPEAPIAATLAGVSEDVRVFNEHLVTLASPFMEGRLPGTRGMEIAKEYVEFWMRDAGLEPAFADDSGEPSFRQPFPLAGTTQLTGQKLAIDGRADFKADSDYTALSLGDAGKVSGEAVFVGYSIENGLDGYSSYTDAGNLDGKIAVMFRFEPMNEDGTSRWSESGWSSKASFANKLGAAFGRGAAAVVIVNTPGAEDRRTESLPAFSMGGSNVDIPVFIAMPNVAEAIFAGDPEARSVAELRRHADEGGGVVPLNVTLELSCEIERKDTIAENVGGLLPGRGELADELIVIGAHMDHLGMGFFGSRDQESAGRTLHPGADDNASGTAGILLIADHMAKAYADQPEDQAMRSVLFIAFSGEESGLNGSRYYVENPIVEASKHALMMNFDMIGRIENKRLGVFGVGTAKGMSDWMEPIFAASPLDVQPAPSGGGGSDHLAFLSKEIPAVFGIIADFHQDYHTPRDTSDKINRVDAVEAAYLWRDMAMFAAARAEPFEFVQQSSGRGGAGRMAMKVRFGISPGNYEEGGSGIAVGSVSSGGSAEAAGILAGDRLATWDGEEIEDVRGWMGMMAKHEPGDAVMVGVERDGEMLELRVVLQAPSGGR